MKRSDLLKFGATAILASSTVRAGASTIPLSRRLTPPAGRPVRAGFLITKDATVIDFTGPWEVFNNISLPASKLGLGGHDYGDTTYAPFSRSTVAQSTRPIRVAGGLNVTPDYDFSNAPQFDVLVIGAQEKPTPATLDWIRSQHRNASVVMSVCVGAFVLAATGLLDGLAATTHHDAYARFAQRFPKVQLVRGVRYVEHDKLASAGGLTSGIDLALRIVERYYGSRESAFTAEYMEYQPSSLRAEIAMT
jgi:transcriptional regulator GlxA family with amidase domain